MPNRYPVATVDELDENPRALVECDGREIAVFNHEGEYYALSNRCPHQGGPLCEGAITPEIGLDENDWMWTYEDTAVVRCPWHTWEFDLETGVNQSDDRYKVPTHDVEVKNDTVYVVL